MAKTPSLRIFSALAPLVVLAGLLGVLASPGCTPFPPKYVVRFYMETRPNYPENWRRQVTLPVTQATYYVHPNPVLIEGDPAGADIAEVPAGKGVLFHFKDREAKTLWQVTAGNIGRRMVLTVNEMPLGVRLIEEPITDGELFMFVELSEKDLPEFMEDLKSSIRRSRR